MAQLILDQTGSEGPAFSRNFRNGINWVALDSTSGGIRETGSYIRKATTPETGLAWVVGGAITLPMACLGSDLKTDIASKITRKSYLFSPTQVRDCSLDQNPRACLTVHIGLNKRLNISLLDITLEEICLSRSSSFGWMDSLLEEAGESGIAALSKNTALYQEITEFCLWQNLCSKLNRKRQIHLEKLILPHEMKERVFLSYNQGFKGAELVSYETNVLINQALALYCHQKGIPTLYDDLSLAIKSKDSDVYQEFFKAKDIPGGLSVADIEHCTLFASKAVEPHGHIGKAGANNDPSAKFTSPLREFHALVNLMQLYQHISGYPPVWRTKRELEPIAKECNQRHHDKDHSHNLPSADYVRLSDYRAVSRHAEKLWADADKKAYYQFMHEMVETLYTQAAFHEGFGEYLSTQLFYENSMSRDTLLYLMTHNPDRPEVANLCNRARELVTSSPALSWELIQTLPEDDKQIFFSDSNHISFAVTIPPFDKAVTIDRFYNESIHVDNRQDALQRLAQQFWRQYLSGRLISFEGQLNNIKIDPQIKAAEDIGLKKSSTPTGLPGINKTHGEIFTL